MATPESWQLDRRIPIALIVTAIIQFAVFVWWASALDTRVNAVELWITNNGKVDARLAVIEQQQKDIKEQLDWIRTRIDGPGFRGPSPLLKEP